MNSRIVLFGATGYTGEGAARALVRAGARPVLAARSAERLEQLADELGGLETAIADVERPETVRALVGSGDVLLSTVGPFARFGGPAIEAAIDAGANYLDSTGEPGFIRRVFEHHGPRARATGSTLLTAFGYDWVPGNLAGELALREAGERATRLEVGYFTDSDMSGGTRSTAIDSILDSSYVLRDRELRREAYGARVRMFRLPGGGKSPGVCVGGTEPFALTGAHPQLRDIGVYVGRGSDQSAAFDLLVRALPPIARAGAAVLSIPGISGRVRHFAERGVPGSTGGPDEQARARTSSTVVAAAFDEGGEQLSVVAFSGVNPYSFTFEILAWGARQLAQNPTTEAGALGPTEAFAVELLESGVAEAGLSRTQSDGGLSGQ